MTLENRSPTEKLLFRYYGLYLIGISEQVIKYVPVHMERSEQYFPVIIENIAPEMIEWDSAIIFDKISETVQINSFYDIDGIALIFQRMKELNFELTIIL